jgi:hypothetical protein
MFQEMLKNSSDEPVASEKRLVTRLLLKKKDADDMGVHADQT